MGRDGVEPSTVGLKARDDQQQYPEVRYEKGQRRDNGSTSDAVLLAREVMQAVLGGAAVPDATCVGLGEAVLGGELPRLAKAVLDADADFRLRRAIELAAAILASDAACAHEPTVQADRP